MNYYKGTSYEIDRRMYTSKLKVEKNLFVFLIDKIHYEETLYGIERMMYISLEISRSQVGKIFLYMK